MSQPNPKTSSSGMSTPGRRFLNYWLKKVGSRGVPNRSDISPFDLRDILEHLFFVQFDPAEDDFRFRLFGGHLVQSVGTDNTGRLLADTVLPEHYREIRDILTEVLSEERTILTHERITSPGREHMLVEILRMPLMSRADKLDTVTGTFTRLDNNLDYQFYDSKVVELHRVQVAREILS